MSDITFVHGCLSREYEAQANKQGYTLGKKAKEVEEMRDAINVLFMHDILTEAQRWNAFRRLQKKIIIPNLKKMEGAE